MTPLYTQKTPAKFCAILPREVRQKLIRFLYFLRKLRVVFACAKLKLRSHCQRLCETILRQNHSSSESTRRVPYVHRDIHKLQESCLPVNNFSIWPPTLQDVVTGHMALLTLLLLVDAPESRFSFA